MSKKLLLTLGLIMAGSMTVSGVFAGNIIYTNDIGRVPYIDTLGYTPDREIRMNEAQANIVNDAVMEFSNDNETSENSDESDITNVIKEPDSTVPVSTRKAVFTSEKEPKDASAPYGYGATNIPCGVNESKTIYTDELGRMHFFGKDSKIITAPEEEGEE